MACQIQASREALTFAINVLHRRRHHISSRPRASWITITSFPYPMKNFQMRRADRRIAFALDTGSGSVPGDAGGGGGGGGGGQQEINGDRIGLGSTRLGRIATAGGKALLGKLNAARKNLPMKIFLLLLGFYTANALATILGQTGDWDVLVAGIVVAAIEGIGMLMYKKKKLSSSSSSSSSSMISGRLQSFIVLMNFWKAGVCLGLFVDAFKLGS